MPLITIPMPGIEPGPPDYLSGILTTEPHRIWLDSELII